jgi:hypothetical protein
MMDRSYVMSKIRKTNTKPELLVRKYLFKKDLDIDYIIRISQEIPILFCLNIKLSYSSTDAFGMLMLIVSITVCLKPELNIGYLKSKATLNGIRLIN